MEKLVTERERMRSVATEPLRIGFLVGPNPGFENWELRIFDRVMAAPGLSLVSFLVHPRPFRRQPISPLFGPLARLEQAVLAREPVYVPTTFSMNNQRHERLPPAVDFDGCDAKRAVRLVSDLGLDLVVRMTAVGLPDEVVRALPFGEWSFSFSDERSDTDDWHGYDSVLRRAPSSLLCLYVRHGADPETQCLASSSFNTKFSAARNAGFTKERAVTLVMRELTRVADTGNLGTVTAAPKTDDAATPPSTGDLLRYAGALSGQLLYRAGKALHTKVGGASAVWTLCTGHGNIEDFDPRQSVEIAPDRDEIRADPFMLHHDGQCYLFYEAYAKRDTKAHIAVARMNGDRLERLGVALERDYHLSYPFVFRHGQDLFMMPETNQARRLEIWCCVEFPLKWELHATALHGLSPADSVLTRYRDRWWLFTNLSDFHAYEDHCSELHVFEVDGPGLSRVVPHKRNPVVLDSTTARNAGRMFQRDGRLYRPSQRNEYGVYGYGLNVMLVEQLDRENYRERCVRTIVPDFKPKLVACHHFDAAGDRYILDARLRN
ncbi:MULTISPECIES: glucosamine inositolphosphorylceramide transferase family protein [Alphaproteobacteria]|uniref:Glucosamine inositolphosphorylceramide transferase 1 N-terminal domain-containing protein n=2 Tax=Alphaproteobacteria TaxID=28211 RepID=A0A512HN36_9HYPH|nr:MULTISPECIES: hypothetical protein [Alphaproteobacteria]GEO86864.1 hypothetical protein RNA01_37960 [Ciceribacter naphthalenivorans]GLR24008.1 hypothetical protein GCM10007920_38020 [Ciceribacter naphthalenivorans]GLT06864.1 hypothetical protein GCM10007926_38020 [Sphingomonas psychrolutea]